MTEDKDNVAELVPKVRLDMWIDKSLKDRLEAVSAETGAPISELVRRSIAAYLKLAKVKGGKE